MKPVCEVLILSSVTFFHATIAIADGWEWIALHTAALAYDSTLRFQIYFYIKIFFSFVNFLNVIVSGLNWTNYRGAIESLECSDRELLKLQTPVDNQKEARGNLKLLVLGTTVAFIYIAVAAFNARSRDLHRSVIMLFLRVTLKYILWSMFGIYAIAVQGAILTRYTTLNQGLRLYFLGSGDGSAHLGASGKERVLLALATIHDRLRIAYRLHSASISIQLLLYFGPFILNLINIIYFIYCVVQNTVTISHYMVLEIYMICYSIMYQVLLVNNATRATHQVSGLGVK